MKSALGSLVPGGIVCRDHGFQEFQTRCRWCKFDPLKNLLPGSASPVDPDRVPSLSGPGSFSSHAHEAQSLGQVLADVA